MKHQFKRESSCLLTKACRMNSIVGRNVLSCCQHYSTNIDSVIAFRFNIENIYRIANTASDDVCKRDEAQ